MEVDLGQLFRRVNEREVQTANEWEVTGSSTTNKTGCCLVKVYLSVNYLLGNKGMHSYKGNMLKGKGKKGKGKNKIVAKKIRGCS